MNFVSYEFVAFLLTVWGLFLALPARYRWVLLLVASYIFYATWSIPFIAVIILSTTVDYVTSKLIHGSASPGFRKGALIAAIVFNLTVLGIFKYFNFFLNVNGSLLGMVGLHNPLPAHLNILLPLGISYYTFEAISYLVDVYRGSKPAPNWWSYNFYIMYFPHLISGPIVRFNELWQQYEKPVQVPNLERFSRGVELIVFGYLYKIVVANNCALIVDPFFANPESYGIQAAYAASVAFACQLYFDFMGYTHIARGCSLLFNIELPLNFNHPFAATNFAGFWQRWQISLSRWLHDYVFRPLGGARKSLPLTMRNVFLTLFIAGVWHGAGWTYVVLGAYFGSCVALYHAYRRFRGQLLGANERRIVNHPVYNFFSHALTFTLVVISAILFRAQTVQTDLTVLGRLARFNVLGQEWLVSCKTGDFSMVYIFLLCVVILLIGPRAQRLYQRIFLPAPYWVKVQATTAAVILCWIFCAAAVPAFIYFQF